MSAVALVDKSRVEIKMGTYGVAPAGAISDPSILGRVQDYRRKSSGRMQPLDRNDIVHKIPAAEYHVSRKVDGEFTVLVFRDGEAFTMNPGGTVRVGLPWLDEAARLLSTGNVKEALIAGELYVARDDRRPRVHDVTTVARLPQTTAEVAQLQFAVFDIMSLNGDSSPRPFVETWKTIEKLFGKGRMIHPVEAKQVSDVAGIVKLFEQWVDQEGAEGLVVRNDTAGTFKIKPRHTLDAAVIGFTESQGDRQGMMHDLLLAVMRPEGTLQVLSRVGGGFQDDQRREMLCDLKDMVVESEYAEVNSDHVAYQMVRPEWVVEISCLDLISQTTRGGTVDRMVLDYHVNGLSRYNVVTKLPLATVISPQFIRRREDKSVVPQEIRIAQVTDVVEVPGTDKDSRQMTLPVSEMLKREVYIKDLKGQTMVRKFLLWKTNKETGSDEFPAYVAHYTDFSPNRKDALAREIRVSSSLEQIQSLFVGLKESNIKAGWQLNSAEVRNSVPAEVRQPSAATSTAIVTAATVETVATVTAASVISANVTPVVATQPETSEAPAKKSRAKKSAVGAEPVAPASATEQPTTEAQVAERPAVKKSRSKKGTAPVEADVLVTSAVTVEEVAKAPEPTMAPSETKKRSTKKKSG